MAVTQNTLGKNAHGCDFEPVGASTKGESRTYILASLTLCTYRGECVTRNVLLFTCSAGFDAGTVFLPEAPRAFLRA